jgi:peptide chain release factor 2
MIRISSAIADNTELIEMGETEGDQPIVTEAEKALLRSSPRPPKREIETLLSGEADANDAYVRSTPGPAAPRARTGPRC